MAERAAHRRLPNGGEEAEEPHNRLADVPSGPAETGTVPPVAQPESRAALLTCLGRQIGAPPLAAGCLLKPGQAWPSWTKGWAAPSHSLIIVKHQCSPRPHPFCPSFVPAYKLKRTETARFCHRRLATPSAVCGTYSTPNFRHEAGMGQGKSSPAYQEGCPGHAPSARGRRAAIHRQKASGGPLASLCPLSIRPLAFHVVKCPLCLYTRVSDLPTYHAGYTQPTRPTLRHQCGSEPEL